MNTKNQVKRTEIATLGEFGLIETIKAKFDKLINPTSIIGIGDDAAVIQAKENEQILLAADMMVEGIHFDLAYTPLKHLGYKAAIINFSDIAAMNGVPTQITVSIAISNRFSVEAIDELYEGIKAACSLYQVDLVGGDTTSSVSGLIISISVLGFVKPEWVVKRSGAKVGDYVCVTGDLGAAYMGLQVLEREKLGFIADPTIQPNLEEKDYLIQRLLKPEARLDIIHQWKEQNFIPSAMIDISDGLASEIKHICAASNVGVQIVYENIPLDPSTQNTSLEFNINPSVCALNGGEDYELLFTTSAENYLKVKNNPDITLIGHIIEKEKGCNLLTENGLNIPLYAQGWNHFEK